MNKLLLYLLALPLALGLGFSTIARATSAPDFVTLAVPDLRQATDFFVHVMNCDPVGNATLSGPSMLLDCGDGTVVQLSTSARQTRVRPRAAIITLATGNAASAAHWLHDNHVTLLGDPTTVMQPGDGVEIVVNFVSPWGQPMQLVSYGATPDAFAPALSAPRLASH